MRLTFDNQTNSLSAEAYDSGTGSWGSVSLGTSDWELYATDVRTLGRAQVGGLVEFEDSTQSPTAYHTLSFQLQRGATDVLFGTSSTVPTGLETLLDPIAASHVYDPYGAIDSSPQGLVSTREVQSQS